MPLLGLRVSASGTVARTAFRPPRVPNVVQRAPVVQRRSVKASFFNFGKKNEYSDNTPSSSRSDYEMEDVEHYFNYMGCLAVEGTYDRMELLMSSGLDPVDVILLLAAAENDDPKVEELLTAGADTRVKDNLGRRPRDLATKESVIAMLDAAEAKAAVSA